MNDLNLVALSPIDLAPTQTSLSAWCTEKIALLKNELAELDEHLLIAKSNGWKLSALNASLNRTAKRVTYYEKLQLAVQEGYLIVPNFPVTTLAVRVAREKPTGTASYQYSSTFNAKSGQLPAGEGRYVDDRVFTEDHTAKIPDGNGGTKTHAHFVASSYDEPDFPFAMVKPVVLAAAQKAMALKVFDEIGMVQNTSGRDPIIVGRLLDPRGNGRCCTFFIAWWLNTADL